MSQDLNQEGTFRGRIIEFGLQEGSGTESVGIAIKAEIDELFDSELKDWVDWREYRVQCYGYVNIIKKDGSPNTVSAENLCKCTGWNGSLDDVANGAWKPKPVQFSTKINVYQDKTSYKIDYINEYDRVPGGGIRSIDAGKAKTLQQKYGSQFKAIAASANKAAQPVSVKPKPAAPAPMPRNDNPPVANSVDEIPF